MSFEMLMCRAHWFMVPYALRRAVWDTYNAGPQTPPHVAAMADAIDAVNRKLGAR